MAEKMSGSGVDNVRSFEEIMRNHPIYSKYIDTKDKYEVWAIHGVLVNAHWFLIIKGERHDQPFVTIEIMSKTGDDLTPIVREVLVHRNIFKILLPTPEKVGTYERTDKPLLDICTHADAVVKEMDSYDLITENCQNFVNKLLIRLGFGTGFPTTHESKLGRVVEMVLKTKEERQEATKKLNISANFDKAPEVYIPA